MSKLVIVESPAKAETIQKYLPEGFVVRACVGHVRDLPKRELGVAIDANFEPTYVEKPGKEEAHTALRRALAEASEVYLATDEDREGEAIAWHLVELFDIDVPVRRMVFNEITPEAIRRGLENTREIDTDLVAAQEARRILDRIVGYPVSELVGHKVLWQLSTGRVQGAALFMVVEQERERRRFKSGSYWDMTASLCAGGVSFDADLKSIQGQRVADGSDIDKYSGQLAEGCDAVLLDGETAGKLAAGAEKARWKVVSVSERSRDYSPEAPFTTASLQRAASSQLGLSANRTMALAQQLYEAGLITYVRTDSTRLSEQAIRAAREAARELYGEANVAAGPRNYGTKSKGAQEAHEAIRPTKERFRHPADIDVTDDHRRLYELIWKRTVASQMADATVTYRRLNIEAEVQGASLLFGAGDKRLDFAGFHLAMVQCASDPAKALAEQFRAELPELEVGEGLTCQSLEPRKHETRPPSRYTESRLIKALEDNGIGRPSTYAGILGKLCAPKEYNKGRREARLLQKRGRTLIPTPWAFAVIQLLEGHVSQLVDHEFTARMETELDEVAAGNQDGSDYLRAFYCREGFGAAVERAREEADGSITRTLKLEGMPEVIRVGRFGPYAKVDVDGEKLTVNLRDDSELDTVTYEQLVDMARWKKNPRKLGEHPDSGETVYLRYGRHGHFVQVGEYRRGKEIVTASVPDELGPEDVTLEEALELLGEAGKRD